MSDITPNPAAVIEPEADPNAAARNAADAAVDHAPKPDVPTPPAPPVEAPATDNGKSLDALYGIVAGLGATVQTLVETVQQAAKPDDSPAPKPWTAWGSGNK